MKAKRSSVVTVMLLISTAIFSQNIKFEKTVHDFGTIKEANGRVTYDFIFKNTGKAPLIINKVTATCGCTTPEWPKRPIMPGKTSILKAIYDPENRPGTFEKTITIYSNAKNDGSYHLKIKGDVIPKALPKLPNK